MDRYRDDHEGEEFISVGEVEICADCFDAKHFSEPAVGAERWRDLAGARDAVEALETSRGGELMARLMPDGDNPFESDKPCGVCGDTTPGQRWQYSIMAWRTIEPEKRNRGCLGFLMEMGN